MLPWFPVRPDAARAWLAILTAVLVLATTQAHCQQLRPPSGASLSSANAADPMVLAVTVNGEPRPEPTYFISDSRAGLMIDEQSLIRWRVVFPPERRTLIDGRGYVPIAAIANMKVEINQARQTAAVELSGESFAKESVAFAGPAQTVPERAGWGGFLNYSLFAQYSQSTTTSSGLFEPGIFGPYGVGTALFGANSATAYGSTQHVVRFDANWRYDDPAKMTTLIAGDSITRAGSWGIPVRFGGIQYGTNFSIQPTFLSFPLQAVSGVAALPSTVDIFINNARVGEQQVQPGPFTITNIPLVSGAGNIQLVVKDLFGREQLVSQSFYASQALLRQGLSDYGVEAGALRQNYGILSNDYGKFFGSGLYRYGFTDSLTGEVRAETSSSFVAAGAQADYQIGNLGIVSAGVVGSHINDASGTKLLAGFQRQTSPLAFAINGEWDSSGFRQLGTIDEPLRLERQGSISAGLDIGAFGSISAAYVTQQYRGAHSTNVGIATYSVPLGRLGFLSISATRTMALVNQNNFSLTLTIPLSSDTFATLGAQRTTGPNSHNTFESASLQKNLPQSEGYGYRVYADTERRYQATGTVNGPYGSYSLGVAQADSVTAVQANVTGGLGVVGGHAFASRQLLGSFGLAQVGGIEGVAVLSENQLVGRTDKDGFVVIPQLTPYGQNKVSIDPLTVPLNATIDSTRVTVVPYVRSGVFVDFPVRRVYAGTINVLLEDGKPIPEGAVATLNGGSTSFPVGFGGEVYVEGLQPGTNEIRIEWHGASCAILLRTSNTAEPVPELGNHVCKGVAR
jgi:outer membrane usher protein